MTIKELPLIYNVDKVEVYSKEVLYLPFGEIQSLVLPNK